MKFPMTLGKNATYRCGHKLHLVKTVTNEDEEECFLCWTHDAELCPDCRAANADRYREVYNAIENPRYDLYTILFKRRSPVWDGSMLFEEKLLNRNDCLRSTRFLVEHDINGGEFVPVGIYKGDHFVPFIGYTAEYMQFLLRHDREAVQAEKDLRDATVDDWKKYLTVCDGCVIPPGMKRELDDQTLYTKVNPEAWGL